MPRCCWILENYDKIQVLHICWIRIWFCFEELQRIGYCYPQIYILKTRLWIGQINCWRLVKTTLVLWIMLLYQLFSIHDNPLLWPYGFILSNFGAALIDVLGLVTGASFGRCCSGFDQIAVTLLWISKLKIQNWLNGNSHFMIQCIFFVVTDRWILKWIVQGSLN